MPPARIKTQKQGFTTQKVRTQNSPTRLASSLFFWLIISYATSEIASRCNVVSFL